MRGVLKKNVGWGVPPDAPHYGKPWLLGVVVYTAREFATKYSDPFFELSTLCQKFLASNTLYI